MRGTINVGKQDNSENCGDNGNKEFDVGSLGKSDNIQKVSFKKESELVAPTCLGVLSVLFCEWCGISAYIEVVVDKVRF